MLSFSRDMNIENQISVFRIVQNVQKNGLSILKVKNRIPGEPKKYSCLIKHNKREVFKNEIELDY